MVAFKVSVVKSYAFILPEPAIEQLSWFDFPFNFMFPEPPIELFTSSTSKARVMFPETPKETFKSSDFNTPSLVILPAPPNDTLSNSE